MLQPGEEDGAKHICDIVRMMFVCKTLSDMARLLHRIRKSPVIKVVRFKDRIKNPSGGWRDAMINFCVTKPDCPHHICEVQIVHQKMALCRNKDGLGGHDEYAQERNAREILEFQGETVPEKEDPAQEVVRSLEREAAADERTKAADERTKAAERSAADADAQCKAAEKKLVGKHVRAFDSLRAGSSRADNESERAGSSRDGAHSQPEQMMAMARWLLRLAFWSKRSKSKVAAETAPVARDAVKAVEDEPVVEDLE